MVTIHKVDSRLFDYPMIVEQALEWYEKTYKRPAPRVTLRYGRNPYSGGYAWMFPSRITLTAGHDALDFACVLYHELTHHVAFSHWNTSHDKAFYKLLFSILRKRKIYNEAYVQREIRYRGRGAKAAMRKPRNVLR